MIPYMNVDLRSINLHYDQRMNWMLNNHQKIAEERQNEKPSMLQKEKSPQSNVQPTNLIGPFPPHTTMIPIPKEESGIRSLRTNANSMHNDYERNFIPRFPIDEHHLAQLNHQHHHMQTKTEPGTNGSAGTNVSGPHYYGETDFDTNYYSKLMSAFLIQDCNPLRTLKDQAGNAVFPNSSHYTDADVKTRMANGFDVQNPAYSFYNEASSLLLHNSSTSGEGAKANEGNTINRKPNAILRLGGEEVTCEVCDKKFPHIWLLKIHSTKHTGRRLRTCELCSKAFVSAFGSSMGGRRRRHTASSTSSSGEHHLDRPNSNQKNTDTNKPRNSYDPRISEMYTCGSSPNRNTPNGNNTDDNMRDVPAYDRLTGLYRAAFPIDCNIASNRNGVENCDSPSDDTRSNNNHSNDSARETAYNRVSSLYRDNFTSDCNSNNNRNGTSALELRSDSNRSANNETDTARNNITEPVYNREAGLFQGSFSDGPNNNKDSSSRNNIGDMRYNSEQLGVIYERETFINGCSSNRSHAEPIDCNNYNTNDHNSNGNEVRSAPRSNGSLSDASSSLSPLSPSTSSTSSSPSASLNNHISRSNNNALSEAGSEMNCPSSIVTQPCDLCNRLFTESDRNDDLDSSLPYAKIYSCDVCNRSYSTLGNLKQHKEKHYGEKSFVCEKCNKSFFTAGNLKQHLITHTGEKSFVCKLCNKTYSTSGNLRQHLLTHTGQKSNFCVICNRSFSTVGNLKQHMLTHFATNLYPCEICKKSYSTLGNLKQHMLTHTGQKIFACDKCDKTFTTLGNAKQHMLRHSGEKPFVCQTCSKSFFTLGNLKQHALTHSQHKLYKCDKCTKSFYTLSNLKQHSSTHSDVKKTYVCEICSRSFSTFGNLKQHKLKHALNIS